MDRRNLWKNVSKKYWASSKYAHCAALTAGARKSLAVGPSDPSNILKEAKPSLQIT